MLEFTQSFSFCCFWMFASYPWIEDHWALQLRSLKMPSRPCAEAAEMALAFPPPWDAHGNWYMPGPYSQTCPCPWVNKSSHSNQDILHPEVTAEFRHSRSWANLWEPQWSHLPQTLHDSKPCHRCHRCHLSNCLFDSSVLPWRPGPAEPGGRQV